MSCTRSLKYSLFEKSLKDIDNNKFSTEDQSIYSYQYNYGQQGYGGYPSSYGYGSQATYPSSSYGYQPQYSQYSQSQYYQPQYSQTYSQQSQYYNPEYYRRQVHPPAPSYQGQYGPSAPPYPGQYGPSAPPYPGQYGPPRPPYPPFGFFGRAGVITAAAVLLIISGIFGIAAGITLIVAGAFPASFAGIPIIGDISLISPWVLGGLGAIYLGLGILTLPAFYLLWRNRRSGGIMAIVLAAISIAAFAITPFFPVLWYGGIIGVVLAVIVIILIPIRWNSLRSNNYPRPPYY